MTDSPPELSLAEREAWRPALKAAYLARGIKARPKKSFDVYDLWNVACFRAARDLFPNESTREDDLAQAAVSNHGN